MANTTPFQYRGGTLCCDGVSLREIAARVDTPSYIYSQTEMLRRANAYKAAAAAATADHLVCFALKANNNLTLLSLLSQNGLGADVTSGGELHLALKAGFEASKILFSGVGKTEQEIDAALAATIRSIHVESEMELEVIAKVAAERKTVAPISVRVNPDIIAETHPHIGTGQGKHKFGLPPAKAVELIRRAARQPWLRVEGLAVHIGSQITELSPFVEAAKQLCEVAEQLAQVSIELKYLDVGGGLGIAGRDENVPDPSEWVAAVAAPVTRAGFGLAVEPGRSIIGPAGVLLTKVIYTKEQPGKQFVILDAGMNDFIRPALYGAYHRVLPVEAPSKETPLCTVDLVGPVCESGDTLGRNRDLPRLQSGDLLAVLNAGAYGFVMSSNYNGRPRPAEVLINDNMIRVIRNREKIEALFSE